MADEIESEDMTEGAARAHAAAAIGLGMTASVLRLGDLYALLARRRVEYRAAGRATQGIDALLAMVDSLERFCQLAELATAADWPAPPGRAAAEAVAPAAPAAPPIPDDWQV